MVAKRHHYVPRTYLEGFTGADGLVWVGRKDDPENPFRARPENAALRVYYYTQLTKDGTKDNRLEDLFGTLETQWPYFRSKLIDGARLSPEDCALLWSFIGIQRVRVPAARDMMEGMLAHRAMRELRALDAAGELLPYPAEAPDIMSQVIVSIDPQKSIEGMAEMLRGFSKLVGHIGFEIVHNQTDTDFVTSDNPVSIFDPSVPGKLLRPYVIPRSLDSIELYFPVDARTAVHGHSALHSYYSKRGPKHIKLKDVGKVRRINRLTARFGYELLIARDDRHLNLLKAYADYSPVLQNGIGWDCSEESGQLTMTFGPRPKKPKWEPN